MDNNTPARSIDFDRLSDDFYALKCIVSPADYHGLVVGRLLGDRLIMESYWHDQSLEYLGLALQGHPPVLDSLLAVPEQAIAELSANDFSFQMILPGDDTDLVQRVEALGSWCEGFLVGLALSGVDQSAWASLTPDLAEGLADIAAIAQIKPHEDDSETDYMQLFEYVRMVVLNAYAELMLADDGEEEILEVEASNVVEGLFKGRSHLH